MKGGNSVRPDRRRIWALAKRAELPLIFLWLALAAALTQITTRVADWYVMIDELLYERLAINIAQTHSPLARVHGELIPNLNQLYPLLISPFFGGGNAPASLEQAHLVNAFVMSSAAVPAFLLARTVIRSTLAGYLVAVLTVFVPWIVLSSFLLTEVVAYPAFLWALLALERSLARPSLRRDLVAAGALVLAILARTQFIVLVLAYPLALACYELVRASIRPRPGPRKLVARAARNIYGAHRLVVFAYAAMTALALALLSVGRLASVLGIYSGSTRGGIFPPGLARSLCEHLALIAFSVGVLPFLIGCAWLCVSILEPKTAEQNAFAAVALSALVLLALEVSSFDLRFPGAVVRDRYLFYLVPLVLVAFAASIVEERWPRWSLVLPTAVVAYGFSGMSLRSFERLSVDAIAATTYGPLIGPLGGARSARLVLALGTIVIALLFRQATVLFRRGWVAVPLVALVVVLLPLETGIATTRLFTANGTSGRPVTLEHGFSSRWIDVTLGAGSTVTMVPYPMQYQDFWASVAYWWDLEFWNEKIRHTATNGGGYAWTSDTFATTPLRFDPRTGRANVTLDRYVAQSIMESRFHLRGDVVATIRGVALIDARRPWRADWLTVGLQGDGWTEPDQVASIRAFAARRQTGAAIRRLSFKLTSPKRLAVRLRSNRAELADTVSKDAKTFAFDICVPRGGYSDVRIAVSGSQEIHGEPVSAETVNMKRRGGVRVIEIALADEIGPACTPA